MAAGIGKKGSVSFNFELLCSSDNSREFVSLLFCPPPKTVADIKRRIEMDLSIPRCFLNLSFADGIPLTDDSQRLANLYLRSGDNLQVTFYARADVARLREDICDVIRPTLERLSTAPLQTKWKDKHTESLLASCPKVLGNIAFEALLPWGSAKSEANRRYFIQEGGLDATLGIYAVLVKLPWEPRNWALQNVEICCLSLLWNFGETAYARQLVADKGGFAMMIQSVMHQAENEFLKKYNMHDIFDTATGCISNQCELECCQLPMAQNKQALHRFLKFAIHGSSVNVFTKMLIANLFFRLSHNQQAHIYLIPSPTAEQLLEFFDVQSSIAIRYILGLTFVRMILLSPESIPGHFLARMSDCLRVVLSGCTANSVSQLEQRYQYNWITILPFLELAYTYGAEEVNYAESHFQKRDQSGDEKVAKELSVSSTPLACLCLMYTVFSLKVEMMRSHNRKLVVRQGLLDYIVMLPWGMGSVWQEHCKEIIVLFREDGKLPLPRLASIAKAKLARTSKLFSGDIK